MGVTTVKCGFLSGVKWGGTDLTTTDLLLQPHLSLLSVNKYDALHIFWVNHAKTSPTKA